MLFSDCTTRIDPDGLITGKCGGLFAIVRLLRRLGGSVRGVGGKDLPVDVDVSVYSVRFRE